MLFLSFYCTDVPVLHNGETFNGKTIRVIIGACGVHQPAYGDKTSLRHVALSEYHLPCVGLGLIRVVVKVTDVSMGMAHVPEGRRVFAELSVYENLKMGAYTRKDKKEIEESLANVYKRFPRLEERKNQMAGTLSGGEQQMLAMGRALMSKPKIILMDEPSMGLSPIFVNEIFDIIRAVSESGTTVLLVEQNAKKALSISDRAYVLETGTITMSGKAKDLLEDEAVKKAYLGE